MEYPICIQVLYKYRERPVGRFLCQNPRNIMDKGTVLVSEGQGDGSVSQNWGEGYDGKS